jgi:hypothetical protein
VGCYKNSKDSSLRLLPKSKAKMFLIIPKK